MSIEQANLRADFRRACKAATAPQAAELWGYLGLEPLVRAPLAEDPKIRWCAQDDPWLASIAALRASPMELEAKVSQLPAPAPGRFLLGRRIETLARWVLSDLLGWELIAHNLPVYLPLNPGAPSDSDGQPGPRRTIGELDLVYRRADEALIRHRELAAKWYIFDPDTPHDGPPCPEGFDAWWGPMRRDRLDLKLGRMCDHQITLGRHPAARAQLGDHSPNLHEIWLSGQLFWPLHLPMEEVPQRVGPRINPHAICGHWARHQQWCQDPSLHRGAGHWYLLDKPTWLAQYHPLEHTTLCSPDPDQPWERPRMLAYCPQAHPQKGWLETRRMFVLPNDWGRTSEVAHALAQTGPQ